MFVLYLKRFRPKVKKEAYCENTKGPVSSHSLTHHHLSLIFRLGTVCLKGKTLSIHCDVCTVHERSFMFLSLSHVPWSLTKFKETIFIVGCLCVNVWMIFEICTNVIESYKLSFILSSPLKEAQATWHSEYSWSAWLDSFTVRPLSLLLSVLLGTYYSYAWPRYLFIHRQQYVLFVSGSLWWLNHLKMN